MIIKKNVLQEIRLQIMAAEANPSPPIGPALGQVGINIMDFCKQFNIRTSGQSGSIIPVIITVYTDKSFTFVLKSSPASILIKKIINLENGSQKPGKEICGTITREQLIKIAKIKINDLNTNNVKNAIKIIEGTVKSIGVQIED